MVLALEASLHHSRKVTTLFTGLVDRDAEWCQTRQIHQQIIDQITEAGVVMATNDGTKGYAILASEGVV